MDGLASPSPANKGNEVNLINNLLVTHSHWLCLQLPEESMDELFLDEDDQELSTLAGKVEVSFRTHYSVILNFSFCLVPVQDVPG